MGNPPEVIKVRKKPMFAVLVGGGSGSGKGL
jgi:hypothetical protein